MRRASLYIAYFLFGVLTLNAIINAQRANQDRRPDPRRFEGRPGEIVIEVADDQGDSTGTAFLADGGGLWLTARHVIDGCIGVGLRLSDGSILAAEEIVVHPRADVGLIRTQSRAYPELPVSALDSGSLKEAARDENGYVFGFPQAQPGNVEGRLLGRARQRLVGRYDTSEWVLIWAETRRVPAIRGELGGASGSPVIGPQGRVVGVLTSATPRRGRFNSVAPENIRLMLAETPGADRVGEAGIPLETQQFWQTGDRLRRENAVAQVLCKGPAGRRG